MIELSRHIEYLLLENDCVIVPELGGFIAHYQSARYDEADGVYLPPVRTVGFNPQLTMNDGLLVQSYMQVLHTDYTDAMRRMEEDVHGLKEILFVEGIAELHGVGVLHYNLHNEYEFHPHENGILSPALYGLDMFAIPLLSHLPVEEVKVLPEVQEEKPVVARRKEIRLNPQWLGNAVAVAIAVVLFFVLSAPVENTYIDKGSYASLGTDGLFDAIRSQSVATVLIPSDADAQQYKKQQVKPVAVKVEKVPGKKVETLATESSKPVAQPQKVAPVEKKVEKNVQPAEKETPKVKTEKKVEKPASAPVQSVKKETSARKRFHIIVASLPTRNDAEKSLQSYKNKGYAGASVVEGNGRFRIAIDSYSDKAEAYKKLDALKKDEAYKSAWLLTSK